MGIAFFLSFILLVSVLLTGAVRKYALKKSILDIPNDRSSHKITTPRGGGLAVAIVFLLSTIYLFIHDAIYQDVFLSLFVSGLLVAAIGFWDDHRSLGRRWRIVVHFIAAIWLFYWVSGLDALPILDNEFDLGVIGNIVGIITLVWLLNLYNFMDGIDGIAAIEAITVASCAAVLLYSSGETQLSVWLFVLVTACIGFLLWNWPPAKIFMGDVGSGFLGMTLGGFAIITSNHSELTVWTWLILLGVFFVDATVTLITRMVKGARWYEAHRSHAYQHAAIKYNSHKKITMAVLFINVFWLFPLAWLSVGYPGYGIVFMLVAYAPLVFIAYLFGSGKESAEVGG